MPVIDQIRRPPIIRRMPDDGRLLEGNIERCGHCMLLWPADEMTEEVREDGLTRVCPNGASPSTDINYTTRIKEQVAADAELYVPRPHFSLVPVERILPATVNTIADSDGELIHNGNPLRVIRDASASLILHGRSFPAAPAALIAFPVGVVSSFTATSDADRLVIDLQFTIAALAPIGTHGITFNQGTLRGVLQVRAA